MKVWNTAAINDTLIRRKVRFFQIKEKWLPQHRRLETKQKVYHSPATQVINALQWCVIMSNFTKWKHQLQSVLLVTFSSLNIEFLFLLFFCPLLILRCFEISEIYFSSLRRSRNFSKKSSRSLWFDFKSFNPSKFIFSYAWVRSPILPMYASSLSNISPFAGRTWLISSLNTPFGFLSKLIRPNFSKTYCPCSVSYSFLSSYVAIALRYPMRASSNVLWALFIVLYTPSIISLRVYPPAMCFCFCLLLVYLFVRLLHFFGFIYIKDLFFGSTKHHFQIKLT